MFFTVCSPWSTKLALTLPFTAPRTASETMMPPGSASACEPRGDVHAVAIHGAVGLLDHVAQVNADAKAHSPVCRACRPLAPSRAERQAPPSTAPARRLEHGQHRVAGHVDDAALVGLDLARNTARAASSAATVARSSTAIRRE